MENFTVKQALRIISLFIFLKTNVWAQQSRFKENAWRHPESGESHHRFSTYFHPEFFLVKSKNRLNRAYHLGTRYKYNTAAKEGFKLEANLDVVPNYFWGSSGDVRQLSYTSTGWIFGKEPQPLSPFTAMSPIARIEPTVLWEPLYPYNSGNFMMAWQGSPLTQTNLLLAFIPIYIPDLKFTPDNNNGIMSSKNRWVHGFYNNVEVNERLFPLHIYTKGESILKQAVTHPRALTSLNIDWIDDDDYKISSRIVYSYGPEPQFRLNQQEFLGFEGPDETLQIGTDVIAETFYQHTVGLVQSVKLEDVELVIETSAQFRNNDKSLNEKYLRNNWYFAAAELSYSAWMSMVAIGANYQYEAENAIAKDDRNHHIETWLSSYYYWIRSVVNFQDWQITGLYRRSYKLLDSHLGLGVNYGGIKDMKYYAQLDLIRSPKKKGYYGKYRTSDRALFGAEYFF